MKKKFITLNFKSVSAAASILFLSFGLSAQTNVFDNVIATSPNHTYLEAALIQEGLDVALQNPAGTLTVFAPDDAAFTSLATALGTNVNGLLALPNLTDILLYHVLGIEVVSSALTNGQIATPLSPTNTLKVTLNGANVYINQAQVNAANLQADNGVVHIIDAVLVPSLANISELSNSNFEVSPNPSSDVIKISNMSADEFSIINNTGSVVKSGKVVNNEISVSDLQNGNYFIQLTNNTGTYQAKFIKM